MMRGIKPIFQAWSKRRASTRRAHPRSHHLHLHHSHHPCRKKWGNNC